MQVSCLVAAEDLYNRLQEAKQKRDLIKVTYSSDTTSLVITEGAETVNTETGEGVVADTIPGTEITPSLYNVMAAAEALYNNPGTQAALLAYLRSELAAQVNTLQDEFNNFSCPA